MKDLEYRVKRITVQSIFLGFLAGILFTIGVVLLSSGFKNDHDKAPTNVANGWKDWDCYRIFTGTWDGQKVYQIHLVCRDPSKDSGGNPVQITTSDWRGMTILKIEKINAPPGK